MSDAVEAAAKTIERALERPPLEGLLARATFAPTGETLVASVTREDLRRRIVGTFQVVALLREDPSGGVHVRGMGLRGHTLGYPVERTGEVLAANAEVLALTESLWAGPFDAAHFGVTFAAWVDRLVATSLAATQKVYEHRMRWENEKPPSRRDVGKRISSGFPIVEATAFNAAGGRARIPKPLLAEFE